MDAKIKKNLALAFAASQLGFMVAAGLLGGLWIDRHYDTTPIFGFVGLVAGFGAGIRILVLLVRSTREKDNETN